MATLEGTFKITLDKLREISPKTEIISTGGGCMAIEVPVGERYFLMTDAASGVELPRKEEGARWLVGWYDEEDQQVGLYEALAIEDVVTLVGNAKPHRAALVVKMKDLESKALAALTAWYEVEAQGDEVPVDGYPFAESLEEVAANLGAFREKLEAWAKINQGNS